MAKRNDAGAGVGRLLAGFLLLSCAAACADRKGAGETRSSPPDLHRLRVNNLTIDVEVAATDAARQRGLMFRSSLSEGRGMLFVFPEAALRSFWMKNTLIALDVAFADEEGTIFQIERMEAMSETAHVSLRPAQYALEMPAGWFAAHGVGPGARMVLPESVLRLPVE